MITRDVRRAIARAVAADGLGAGRSRPAPDRHARAVRVQRRVRFSANSRVSAAARIAARLAEADGIARAEVTGPGFITITVTPEALAALPDRVVTAGPACAASDALRGVTVPRAARRATRSPRPPGKRPGQRSPRS